MNASFLRNEGEEKSDLTPIRQSRFCAGYFDISREFGSTYHFVDIILRRPNPGSNIWICTQNERRYLNGALNLGVLTARIFIANDNIDVKTARPVLER